jgi:hypothetical protein
LVREASLDLAAPTDPPLRNESALRDAERQALALALTRHSGSRRALAEWLCAYVLCASGVLQGTCQYSSDRPPADCRVRLCFWAG